VERFERAIPLLRAERRFVDEQVRPGRRLDDGFRRGSVPCDDDPPTAARLAQHEIRGDDGAVVERDRLATLESASRRPVRNAETIGYLDVEAAGPRFLEECVADRSDAVVDGKCLDHVRIAFHAVARAKLDQLERIRKPSEDPAERSDQVAQAGWSVDRERELATSERERLHHAGKTEVVIRVVVGEEHVGELGQPDVRPEQLALCAFGTVDEKPVASAPNEQGRRGPLSGWGGARCPEEDDVEVHGGRILPPGRCHSLVTRVSSGIAAADNDRMGTARGLRDSVGRSVTLLHVFLVASATILVAGAVALGGMLTRTIDRQVVEDERAGIVQYVGSVVTPELVRNNRIRITRAAAATLARGMRVRGDLLSVKVWRRDGLLLWTTLDKRRIGKHFPVTGELEETLATGEPHGAVEDLSKALPGSEETAERRTGVRRALEVYAPIRGADGRLLGAYEVYGRTDHLDAVAATNVRTIWFTVAGVFGALLMLLTLLVRGASRRLHRQTDALRHSYRMLEESSLETIETLNATVEAKDPYTAGHSQRVRSIALAIGRELGLSRERLETLGASALFHDVGKIGVPDAILTKPGKLDAAEFETIKQHAARGAEIVSKQSRLKDSVPAIRHHHERWDGLGYPDGLVGDQIPLEASIVGLADAWDAMTTERPYARALTLIIALEQVRAGRGTQFRPEVVDAFLTVAASLPPDQSSAPVRALRPVAAAG